MTLMNKIYTYEYTRELVLGSRLGLRIETPQQCKSRTDFDGFVTAYYVALYETASEDAAFLVRAKVLKRHSVIGILKKLRTAVQHENNLAAKNFYDGWLGAEPLDWDEILARLDPLVHDYLVTLIAAANTVRQSPRLKHQWKESAEVSVPSIFEGVCNDLNLTFPPVPKAAKVREVESRYKRELHHSGTKKKIITDLCVQEVLSEKSLLPIDYSLFLDELGLLGSPDARSAITLAYATAQVHPGLSGADFRRKVSELWWSLVIS